MLFRIEKGLLLDIWKKGGRTVSGKQIAKVNDNFSVMRRDLRVKVNY